MSGKTKSSSFPARYFSFREYLWRRFGARVHKLTIDAGFSCPNRDGTTGYGGCTFCNNAGFNHASRGAESSRPTIAQQLEAGMSFARRRYGAEKFIAYFQAYTNTHDRLDELRRRYEQALEHPDVVGLAVGTRPDCVAEPVLDLLEGYAAHTEVWLEYGLQSIHDRTLRAVNRGHDSACFFDAVERTRGRGIKICVHVILGLPGETREEMLATARAVGQLDVQGLKIHSLHIMERTIMARQYREGLIRTLERDEFVQLAVDFLEWIPPTVTIQRLTADAPPPILIAPQWCRQKAAILNLIHTEMERRDFQQGSRWT